MDIVLRTNDPEAGLELRGFHRFADGSGFRTLVCIRSGEFSAQVPYYFEPHPFNRFIGELEALDRSLSGSATLRPMWEERPHLTFSVDRAGRLAISGLLEYGTQEVRFELVTDQTCLRPFVTDLRSSLDAPAT